MRRWDVETGKVLQEAQLHDKQISDMQVGAQAWQASRPSIQAMQARMLPPPPPPPLLPPPLPSRQAQARPAVHPPSWCTACHGTFTTLSPAFQAARLTYCPPPLARR